MKIAVAVTNDALKVSGHAGRARHWLVYDGSDADAIAPTPPRRVDLDADMVFHHYEDEAGKEPHPLDGIEAIIAISAGEGFLKHMAKRGVEVALTAETDPAKAVSDYLTNRLSAPKPRPIGALICKTLDLFSKHK
jgi:predicted Fe-Mo cluster-binding NifX family protein